MPLNKYKNSRHCDLPEPYLVWFHFKGFPADKQGQRPSARVEIKANGLEYLLKQISEK